MDKVIKVIFYTVFGFCVALAVMILLVTFMKDLCKSKQTTFAPMSKEAIVIAIPPNVNVDSFIYRVSDSLNKKHKQ